MLEHGGKLRVAASRYGIPRQQWLDLSTGINPNGWPVPTLPAAIWQRLPEDEDGLVAAAQDYYQALSLLPVAGSQAAIQLLPKLRPACRVGLIAPGYAEHAAAWERAGHSVQVLTPDDVDPQISALDVLLLINPNNPTGHCFERQQLLDWRQQLARRGGWLIIDEAFIDCTPQHSLTSKTTLPGLIVLRSLGKFFGLAGIRMGFVLAEPPLLRQLHEQLGPWAVSSPARWIASRALRDSSWQQQTRQRLPQQAQQLAHLLQYRGLNPAGSTAFFHWIVTPEAAEIHHRLARQGVLTRHFSSPASLRFGLPADQAGLQRLATALQPVSRKSCCA